MYRLALAVLGQLKRKDFAAWFDEQAGQVAQTLGVAQAEAVRLEADRPVVAFAAKDGEARGCRRAGRVGRLRGAVTDARGEGNHAQLLGGCPGGAVQLSSAIEVARTAPAPEYPGQVVLAVRRPWSCAHPLVHLDGRLQVIGRVVEPAQRGGKEAEVAVDGAERTIALTEGVTAREGSQLTV